MREISPYGVQQHAVAERVTANQMVGERTSRITANANAGGPALFSTAPYKPPLIDGRLPSRIGRCKGKDDTCEAHPVRGTDWCYYHTEDDE